MIKNSTNSKQTKLIFICLFIFISSICTAAESSKKNWSFSIEPYIGLRYGYLGEHLYYLDNGEYKQLSYLEWEMKPLLTYGGNISYTYKNFNVSTYIKSAASLRCGNMYDSDWVELTDTKNDYSISENTLSSLIETGIAANYKFKPQSWLQIGPEISFDYSYISFEARNGYGWYGDYSNSSTHTNVSYDSDDATYYSSGELCGIDYNRTSFLTWIGINSSFTPFQRWSFGVSAAVSPYAFEYVYDHHYASSASDQGYYLDEVTSLFSRIKGTVSIIFAINKNFAIKLSGYGLAAWAVQGKTYNATYDSSSNSYPVYYIMTGYKGGISSYYAECVLGCKITI